MDQPIAVRRVRMIAGPPTPEFYTGSVYLPVRSPEDGLWRSRSRFLEDGIDWPMVSGDSMGALLLALRAIANHFEAVRKYLGVSLYHGNSTMFVTGAGIPLWPPVEREQAWPQTWDLELFDECPITPVTVDRDLIVAERVHSVEQRTRLTLRIGLSPRDGHHYRGFVEIGEPRLAARRYEVSGIDSMEVLEQAVLTAAVRLPFVDPDLPQYPNVRDP